MTTNFWGKLREAWRQSHWLFKMGMVGLLLTTVAENVLTYTTPVALWNTSRNVREQVIITTAEGICAILMMVGRGLRLRQEMREEREKHL